MPCFRVCALTHAPLARRKACASCMAASRYRKLLFRVHLLRTYPMQGERMTVPRAMYVLRWILLRPHGGTWWSISNSTHRTTDHAPTGGRSEGRARPHARTLTFVKASASFSCASLSATAAIFCACSASRYACRSAETPGVACGAAEPVAAPRVASEFAAGELLRAALEASKFALASDRAASAAVVTWRAGRV